MSEAGGEIPTAKPAFLEQMAVMAKNSRPESGGEKLRRLAKKEYVPTEADSTPPKNNIPAVIPEKKSAYEDNPGINPKKNRVAIKHELRVLDDQARYAAMNRRPGIIKAGKYRMEQESILVGGDPKTKIVAVGSHVPDIAPLPDEVTPRIQAEQIKKP